MDNDIQYYNEEELKQLDIMSLRDAARSIGVQSCYAKRKEELIKAYLDIAEGKEVPPAPKRGRPVGSKTRKAKPFRVAQPAKIVDSPELVKQIIEHAVFFDDHGNPLSEQPSLEGLEPKWGVLDVNTDGYGFLRADNCEYGNKDCYVSMRFIRSVGLRPGDKVIGLARKNVENKPPALVALTSVNDAQPKDLKRRPVQRLSGILISRLNCLLPDIHCVLQNEHRQCQTKRVRLPGQILAHARFPDHLCLVRPQFLESAPNVSELARQLPLERLNLAIVAVSLGAAERAPEVANKFVK